MNDSLIQYQSGNSKIETFNGASRVLFFLGNLCLLMVSMDARIIVPLGLLQIGLLVIANPGFKRIRLILWSMLLFNLINILMFYVANPTIGNQYTESYTILFKFNEHYIVTLETLYYFIIRIGKIVTIVLSTLWFITTITPSEFSAGLNALGLSARMCMIISLAFRFIPDVAKDYHETRLALQLRGMEFDSKRISIYKRLKQTTFILVPLIVLSFENVKGISNAMDLRGFGSSKKRTYYVENPSQKRDKIVQAIGIAMILLSIVYIVLRIQGVVPEIWLPL